MIIQDAPAFQVGRFQAVLPRTVATVPIVYAGAHTHAHETHIESIATVAAVCSSGCIPLVVSGLIRLARTRSANAASRNLGESPVDLLCWVPSNLEMAQTQKNFSFG